MSIIQRSSRIDSPVLNRFFVQEGDFVFREGARGDKAYIVQDGVIEIFKHKGDDEICLGTVSQGGIFGEMSLIDGQPRMASARAAEPSTLIVVGRGAFAEKMAACDPFLVGLMKILAGNVRMLTDVVAGNRSLGAGTDKLPAPKVPEKAQPR